MFISLFSHGNAAFNKWQIITKNIHKMKTLKLTLTAFCIVSLTSLFTVNTIAQCNNFKLHNNDNPLKGFKVASGIESHPFFVDIDGDGDQDCFSGEYTPGMNGESKIYFFKNEGNSEQPAFKKTTGAENPFDKLLLPVLSIPNFIDIDADGDYDCFLGDGNSGALRFYKNEGTAKKPVFEKQSAALNPLSLVKISASTVAEPAFADIDGDGDFDCLVADIDGDAHYFKNTGSAREPYFEHLKGVANPFNFLKYYEAVGPSFYDWNNDGLPDLFLGTKYYKNTGTKTNPAFTENKTDGPKFSTGSFLLPLRWVNLNNAAAVSVITGTASGSFNFLSTSIDASVNPEGKKVIAKGAALTMSATPNNSLYTYQWMKDGEVIAGATKSSFAAVSAGNYTVKIKGGCGTSTTNEANISLSGESSIVAAIPEVSDVAALNIQAFPNPTKDEFSVRLPVNLKAGTTIRITDLSGKLVETKKSGSASIKFGKQFIAGVYFLQVYDGDKLLHQQKLIKN